MPEKDGLDTSTIKHNPGEAELSKTIEDAFDKLEAEGTDLEGIGNPPADDPNKDKPADTPQDDPNKDKPEETPQADKPEKTPPDDNTIIDDDLDIEDDDDDDHEYDLEYLQDPTGEGKKKKEDPEKTPTDDDDAELAEIEEIRNNPHTSEKTKKGFDRLTASNTRLKAQLDEANAKLETLSGEVETLKSTKAEENPISDQERKELNMLRMRHSIGSDENIKKNYDNPISLTEKKISEIVDKVLPEAQAKQVNDMGFENFARQLPESYKEFINILNEKSPFDANILNSSVTNLMNLKASRQEEVDRMTQDADQYFQNQEEEQKKQLQERQAYVKNITDETYRVLIKEDPKFQEINTKDLSGEELKIAEKNNKRTSKYRDMAKKHLTANTPEERQRVFYLASLQPWTADLARDLAKKVKTLEGKLAKIQKARGLKPSNLEPTPKKEEEPVKDFNTAMDKLDGSDILRPTRSIPS